MNISNFQNKKYLLIVLSLVIILLSYFFLFKGFGKVDEWKYTYSSPEKYLIGGAVIGGIIIIGWIIFSIYLIISGKPLINSDGSKTRNPKRFMGIFLLAGPLFLLLISFILIINNFEIILFSVPILLLIFLIGGIIYSIKNKVKIALIPLVIVPIVIIGLGGFVMLFSSGIFDGAMYKSISAVSSMAESANIGFSTGGAKDINNFRKNIENNYLPLPTDITYEGLFYDYYFDTGEKEVCTKLFCPSYNYAISKDPFSKEEEYYLSVGLNSGVKESDFKRKKLNLVIVLDISGSMSSAFNSYYYDQFGKSQLIEDADNEDNQKSKMQVAREAVVGLLDHLNPDDRFGMVLFDDVAYLGKPLSLVSDTDMNSIKGHILELQPRGGTYFEAGYKDGTKLFDEYMDTDQSEYENRIIFITDAMPNIGQISEEGLFGLTKENADNKIYTTFIGVGVDFNTELIEYITKIRGANYYSVHSGKEFKQRMDNEFEYMVTPLAFNLNLNLDAKGYKIEKVYGSPEANEATGEIMKVNTLFPSKKENKETRGGIVILKLKKISSNADLKLRVSYEDRLGKVDTNEVAVKLESKTSDFYENTGIRKGILLSRYADLMKNWINDEKESYTKQQPIKPAVNRIEGIVIPPDFEEPQLGKWERQSIPLKVSQEYKDLIKEFKIYFESEMNVIGDNTLSKEINVMNKLIE
ncbi:VWA domain-containing protein [Candidatus Woesearchaeota archaeon]|nr:VWA domain-containing protein [Candidatus Woesearchaeota archaeon]